MSGTMTDGEVITSFRQAKNKREQIGILSELNLCSKSDILNILCAAGEDVSDYISGRPKKKPAEKKSGAPDEARPAARRWSEDEETILREGCFAGGSCGDIAQALGRTEKSVYFKAREMGLTFSADKASPAAPDADLGEAVPEEADAKVMDDGCGGDTAGADQSGKLGDILDMICRLVSAMACEPGKVHIDMPDDDAALLEMDFGSCAVRVTL